MTHSLQAIRFAERFGGDHKIASTGSEYVTISSPCGEYSATFRFADHGDCYETSMMSVSPDGHSYAQACAMAERILAGEPEALEMIDSHTAAVNEMQNEMRHRMADNRRAEVESLGGADGVRAAIDRIAAKLSVKAHEGGPRGDGRKSLKSQKQRLVELLG